MSGDFWQRLQEPETPSVDEEQVQAGRRRTYGAGRRLLLEAPSSEDWSGPCVGRDKDRQEEERPRADRSCWDLEQA